MCAIDTAAVTLRGKVDLTYFVRYKLRNNSWSVATGT